MYKLVMLHHMQEIELCYNYSEQTYFKIQKSSVLKLYKTMLIIISFNL